MQLKSQAIRRARKTVSVSNPNDVGPFNGYNFDVHLHDEPTFMNSVDRILEYYINFIGQVHRANEFSVCGPFEDDGDPYYIIQNKHPILMIIGSPNFVIKNSYTVEDVVLGKEVFTEFREYIEKQLALEGNYKETD